MAARYAIVVARFYVEVADRLVASARSVFESDGAEDVDVFDVPGAFELPLAALYVAPVSEP
jgi:6,7-dimethyl-8-ribityllumazine synthase